MLPSLVRNTGVLRAVLKLEGKQADEFCETYQQGVLGRAEGLARDSLDSKISALESQIATAPAIALADPGAAVAADMLGWLSHGGPSVHDFRMLRILILTLMPAFARPRLGLSMRLCRADHSHAPVMRHAIERTLTLSVENLKHLHTACTLAAARYGELATDSPDFATEADKLRAPAEMTLNTIATVQP
jgi:hypothetical protein